MTIYTVNYRETIFEHPNLSKIIGVLTYDNLHIPRNNIESNGMRLDSNIGGRQHGYIGLVEIQSSYALLSNTHFVHQMHPGTLIIPTVACTMLDDVARYVCDVVCVLIIVDIMIHR